MTTASDKYADYLQSDYWQKVSAAVKKRGGYRCQVCNSQHDLQAHHRTYDHRGKELDHLDDLICMCRRCHGIFHGKEQAPAVAVPAPVVKPLSKKQRRQLRALVEAHKVIAPVAVEIPSIDGLMPLADPIVLTRELVDRCQTLRGGLTSATISALGVPFPLESGWRPKLVGKSVSRQAYRQALEGKWQFSSKKTLESNKRALVAMRGNDATA